jgi:hypothetical protein
VPAHERRRTHLVKHAARRNDSNVVALPGLPRSKTIRSKTIRVATPYTSVDELVTAFARYYEPDACFVPSPRVPRSRGRRSW